MDSLRGNRNYAGVYGFHERCAGQLINHESARNGLGSVDSNPYSVLLVEAHGTRFVADAGGNTLVRVGRSEAPSLGAVFPDEAPQSVPNRRGGGTRG